MSPFPAPHCATSLKSDPRPALELVAVSRFNAVAVDITRIVAAAATRLKLLRRPGTPHEHLFVGPFS
jgi:hypothetical protein